MWEELGISSGTAIIVLIALYFIIKWAVKNGVKEAYRDISRKERAGAGRDEDGSGSQEDPAQAES